MLLRGVLFIVRAGNDIIKSDFIHTKRISFPTKIKIAILSEKAQVMHRNWHLFAIRVFSGQKNQYV